MLVHHIFKNVKSAIISRALMNNCVVRLPLQTPTLLLTPSPLLSNIHFWSTLSPVAPLSPATRRQGGHLFQVSTLEYTVFTLCVYDALKCPNTPFGSLPVSICPYPSVPDPCTQYGWDQHTWPHFPRPSEDIGLTCAASPYFDTDSSPHPLGSIFTSHTEDNYVGAQLLPLLITPVL